MEDAAPNDRTPRRNFGLDVLRCLAIGMVLANHAFLGFFVDLGQVAWTGRAKAASLLSVISIEWLFVLSGFLIGTMMIRTFEAPGTFWGRARSFWLRRWFRTLPNYYLFLLVNLAILATGWHGRRDVGDPSWRHAVFAQNLAWPEDDPFFFAEAWSLALDEWFYLLLPLLVGVAFLGGRARPRAAFLIATSALILVPTALRLAAPVEDTPLEWDRDIRRVTLFHLDGTGWGVLAASVNRWWPAAWNRHVAAKAAGGVVCMTLGILAIEEMFFGSLLPGTLYWRVFTLWPRVPAAFGLSLMGVGTVLAFPAITRLPRPGGVVQTAIAATSNYSYSLYLSHFPLLFLLGEVLAPDGSTGPVASRTLWVATVAWLVLTFAVSALVYHSFEKPVSDQRERFTRKVDASPFGPATPP